MWTVTFYQGSEILAEIDIPDDKAKTRIHAIVRASEELPETLDRSDDVDAIHVPEIGEEVL